MIAGRFVGVDRVAGHLGVSRATAKRLCRSGAVPARLGPKGAYEVEVSDLESLRRQDVVLRASSALSRAAVLGALDAARRVCRALGADGPPRSVVSLDRWEEASREARRVRADLLAALGMAAE